MSGTTRNPNVGRRRTRRRGRSNQLNVGAVASGMIRATKVTNPEPPQFEVSHHYVQRCRFVCTNAVQNYPINPSDIANLMLAVVTFEPSTGPINAVAIWTRFLIKSIEMWATATALTTPATLTLSLQNLTSGPTSNTEQTQTDTAKSIDQYAYVKLRPKITSPAGQWQTAQSTGGGFIITCPAGTILDLWLHVFLNNDDAVPLVTFANNNTNLEQGSIVMNYLDANSTTLGYFQPQGYLNPSGDSEPTPRPT